MMLDLEKVQDGEYYRANGILVCFVKNSKVFVRNVDGITDYGLASKINVQAVVKSCRKLVKKLKEEKMVEKEEFIADLICFAGQILIIDTIYYLIDEYYEGWFKCFAGGDVLINGLDRTMSWIDTNAQNITELVADILNVPYDVEKGISENIISSFGINEVINKLTKKHVGINLFPDKSTFTFENYLDN